MALRKLACDSFTVSFQKLLKEKLPIKTSFKLREIKNVIEEEVIKFQELKQIIIERYALKNEDGTIKERSDNGRKLTELDLTKVKEYNSEQKELGDILVDIPILRISDLYNKGEDDDSNSLTLVAGDICNLEFIMLM